MKTVVAIFVLIALASGVTAQDTTKVVKSKPMQIKAIKASDFTSSESKVEVKGDYDMPFAHPACAELDGDERKGCTNNALIENIKANFNYDPAAAGKHVDADDAVEIKFSINQFGNVKSIHVVYTGDPRITQSIIQALYSVPRMLPAKKEGKSVPCSVSMSVPYDVLFTQD